MFRLLTAQLSTARLLAVLMLTAIALCAQAQDGESDARATDTDPFHLALAQLAGARLRDLPAAVQAVAAGGDQSLPYLQGLLDGRLHFRKSDRKLFVIDNSGSRPQAFDPASGAVEAIESTSDFKRIIINNSVRGQLRELIARLQLESADEAKRIAAVRAMLTQLGDDDRQMLQQALERERSDDVAEMLQAGLALIDLNSSDAAQRSAALDTLYGNIVPEVRNRVLVLAENDVDEAVREQARSVVASIDTKRELFQLAETVFFGLSLGSVLLLAAIGLAITFGVMGVINMAHGELIMLGAYTTYVVQLLMPSHIEYSLLVALPAAFIVAGLVGVAIERGVIRWLYGRPLETLLATFGLSLVLQQAVRSIFSPLNRSVTTPEWMSGSWQINPIFSLTFNRLYIVIFALIVFVLLLLLLKKSSLGLYVRAVSQNRAMAKAMGIRSDWVDALTFGLGSGIAGIAGVALSQLTNVGPNMGQAYIIDSFMVVVFGGVGNLWGTLVGALSLGVANKFLEPVSGAVLAKILVLIFIILFIQKRPRGLFPQKGRAAEG
jgi:urea transport system permease protein